MKEKSKEWEVGGSMGDYTHMLPYTLPSRPEQDHHYTHMLPYTLYPATLNRIILTC
jgi:hypothetical protein